MLVTAATLKGFHGSLGTRKALPSTEARLPDAGITVHATDTALSLHHDIVKAEYILGSKACTLIITLQAQAKEMYPA